MWLMASGHSGRRETPHYCVSRRPLHTKYSSRWILDLPQTRKAETINTIVTHTTSQARTKKKAGHGPQAQKAGVELRKRRGRQGQEPIALTCVLAAARPCHHFQCGRSPPQWLSDETTRSLPVPPCSLLPNGPKRARDFSQRQHNSARIFSILIILLFSEP